MTEDLDTITATSPDAPVEDAPRRTYDLDETGFREVPKKWRKFYRHWQGAGDSLAPNEVICPVCKVVIRSRRELNHVAAFDAEGRTSRDTPVTPI